MKKIPTFILLAAAALLAWIWLRHPSTPHPTELRAAPDFSLTDLSGHGIRLSEYRGQVVLLDFWATWCEPCKTEIPHFIDMQNRYAAQGLRVIGISMDDEEKPVRDFQQQFKMNYPVAIGNAKLAESYGGILGLPITFVIDRQGRIYKRHIGQTEPSVFEGEIRKLLATN
jgi:cytochrome c biogenesis protein CcmG/thiol:disulfide interchange protein DsbE